MEIIYRKHMDKSTRNVFIFCTTNGWWGLCGFVGVNSSVKENIPLEMRGSLSIGGEETEWHKAWRNGMERNWLLIVGGLAKLLTEVARVSPVGGKSSRKAKWNDCLDLWHGVTEPLMLWGAEVGEMYGSGMKCRESK